MPIHKILVKEFECKHCQYRWVNRINGRDGPTPERCARCKRKNWLEGPGKEISPKERGLRRIIRGFTQLYENDCYYSTHIKNLIGWDENLCERFLNIKPRPSIKEIELVVYSSPLKRYNNGSDYYRMKQKVPVKGEPGQFRTDRSGLIQDPKKLDKIIYNPDPNFVSDYLKVVINEAHIRQSLMNKIINSRTASVHQP